LCAIDDIDKLSNAAFMRAELGEWVKVLRFTDNCECRFTELLAISTLYPNLKKKK